MMKLLRGGVKIPVAFKIITEDGDPFDVEFDVTYVRANKPLKKRRQAASSAISKKIQAEISRQEAMGAEVDSSVSEEDTDRLNKLIDELGEMPEKWLEEDITGWEGLIDLDGSEVKYSKKQLRELLNYEPFVKGLTAAWSSSSGVSTEAVQEADSKN